MATSTNINDFLATYGDLAKSVAADVGATQEQVLGQWALETGYGTHFAGRNNPGNVMVGGSIGNFPTLQAGAAAYEGALRYEHIQPGLNNQAFADALQAGGYGGSDPNYAANVLATINSVENRLTIKNFGNAQAGAGPAPIDKILGDPTNSFSDWVKNKSVDIGFILLGGVMVVVAVAIGSKKAAD